MRPQTTTLLPRLLAVLVVAATPIVPLAALGDEPQTDALRALIPGAWHGMLTAEGLTTHLIIDVEPTGAGYTGEGLLWAAMTYAEALQAQLGALPRQGIHPRALAVAQRFDVRFDGEVISFEGRAAAHLIGRGTYSPDTFAGPLKPAGTVVGTARDTRRVGGIFQLWRAGALRDAEVPELEKGKTHELEARAGKRHHYTCYVPDSYEPARPAPLLVNYSPTGNGQPLSVKMADELGWLMVGLTESRNGPMAPNLENLNAALFDVRRRLNIHTTRIYFSGFSGGARMASWAGINHQDSCAGIMCIGAGFYDGPPPPSQPIFFIVGQGDFNRDEVVKLHTAAQRSIRKTSMIIHPGGHTWGRPQDHEAAIRWFDRQRNRR